MKRFGKRLLIGPVVFLFILISIILWMLDLTAWIMTGIYNSEYREAWEKSELAGKVIDPLFDWSNK